MAPISLQEVLLPIEGMSCSGCAVNVERALRQRPGVTRADVNLAGKRAAITFDPNQSDLTDFQAAVENAGYSIPTSTITLTVEGMSCISCASHVGGALEDLAGVLSAEVNLTKGTAQVVYLPDLVTVQAMKVAVENVGYQVIDALDVDASGEPARVPSQETTQPAFTTARFSRFKKLIGKG